MNNKNTAGMLDIDIDKLIFPAIQGIRRAYAFAGIVCNPLNSVEIKDEFKFWVLRNCITEIIELFSITLDEIYYKFYFVKNHPKSIDTKIINKVKGKLKSFHEKSFPDKLKEIKSLLNDDLKTETEFFKSIQSIRNVITHNSSLVKNKNGKTIMFLEIKMYLEGNELEARRIEEINEENPMCNTSDKPAKICLKIEFTDKHFKKGEKINFTPIEIVKICYAMDESIKKLKLAMIKTINVQSLKDYEGNEIMLELPKHWADAETSST